MDCQVAWCGRQLPTADRHLGCQQAFFLLIGVCVALGDKVAMEEPGYHRLRALADSRGARIVPVPVDDEGIVVEAIQADVKVVYVTPWHQFPTGVAMSMSRRLQLLQLARDAGIVIIEDDYDSEFRYVDRPLEPLYRLDRSGLVSYVGSFSKTLSPALRLGFAVVPAHLYAMCWTCANRWTGPVPCDPSGDGVDRRHRLS